MANEIKVSVVVPVYNAEKYLRQCLDSILAQTLREIEVVCVDDGSTDSSPQILAEYAAKDSRVSVYRQANQYAGVARNTGKSHAKGEYLAFWDSDDFFKPEALEKMYRKAKEDAADICVCGAYLYPESLGKEVETSAHVMKKRIPQLPFNRLSNPDYILNFTTVEPWNKLYRRAFIEEQGLEFLSFRNGEDVFFVEGALCLAERITAVWDHLVCYRRGQGTSLVDTVTQGCLNPPNAWIITKQFLEERGAYPERSFQNRCVPSMFNLFNNLGDFEAVEKTLAFFQTEGLEKLNLTVREPGYYLDPMHNEFVEHLAKDTPGELITWLNHLNMALRVDLRSKRNLEKQKNRKLTADIKALKAERAELMNGATRLHEAQETARLAETMLAEEKRRNKELKKKEKEIRDSWSYRLGHALMWLPGRIKRRK